MKGAKLNDVDKGKVETLEQKVSIAAPLTMTLTLMPSLPRHVDYRASSL